MGTKEKKSRTKRAVISLSFIAKIDFNIYIFGNQLFYSHFLPYLAIFDTIINIEQ